MSPLSSPVTEAGSTATPVRCSLGTPELHQQPWLGGPAGAGSPNPSPEAAAGGFAPCPFLRGARAGLCMATWLENRS